MKDFLVNIIVAAVVILGIVALVYLMFIPAALFGWIIMTTTNAFEWTNIDFGYWIAAAVGMFFAIISKIIIALSINHSVTIRTTKD